MQSAAKHSQQVIFFQIHNLVARSGTEAHFQHNIFSQRHRAPVLLRITMDTNWSWLHSSSEWDIPVVGSPSFNCVSWRCPKILERKARPSSQAQNTEESVNAYYEFKFGIRRTCKLNKLMDVRFQRGYHWPAFILRIFLPNFQEFSKSILNSRPTVCSSLESCRNLTCRYYPRANFIPSFRHDQKTPQDSSNIGWEWILFHMRNISDHHFSFWKSGSFSVTIPTSWQSLYN